MVNETEILKSLANIKDPETGHDLASSGAVKGIGASGDQVSFSLELGLQAGFERDQVKEEARKAGDAIKDIQFDEGYTSVLKRAIDTLEIIKQTTIIATHPNRVSY